MRKSESIVGLDFFVSLLVASNGALQGLNGDSAEFGIRIQELGLVFNG